MARETRVHTIGLIRISWCKSCVMLFVVFRVGAVALLTQDQTNQLVRTRLIAGRARITMEKTTPTMGALEALGTLEDRDKRGPGSRMAKAGGGPRCAAHANNGHTVGL